MLIAAASGNLDILLLTETKLDSSFPNAQFEIKGYTTPYRVDRDVHGGGLLLYVREDIPSKLLIDLKKSDNQEGIFVEINLRKKKWVLCCSYNPHKSNASKHTDILGKHLDLYSSKYENYLILGDFNSEPTETVMNHFCELYNLRNLVKDPTCFKNPENPSCIDLILTNRPRSFQCSQVIETGLSDFHKMTVTVMKSYFKKQEPKIVNYRDYRGFCNNSFRLHVNEELIKKDISVTQLDLFVKTFLDVLNRHAPVKQKYIRANQAAFMNKTLQKAVMDRSRLRNKFLRDRSNANKVAYNRQRNYCVSLFRKEKRNFFENLDTKKITDNKEFWRTVKPFFADKAKSNDRITLVKDEKIISNGKDIAEIFNNFFVNVVSNLNISFDQNLLCESGQTDDPIRRIIEQYKNHPSILAINDNVDSAYTFSFNFVTFEDVFKEIRNLDKKKASQDTDIPTRIIKENADIIAKFLFLNFNNAVRESKFPDSLKNANVTPVYKKDSRTEVTNYRPVSILPNLSKIYERLIYSQMSAFFDNILTKYQCGFRQGYSSQQCLLAMVEKWKNL